jgi:hypothetical protein
LSGRTDDDLRAGDGTRAVRVLRRCVVLGHRQITRVGGEVACQRGEIAGVRDRVALAGGVQSRLSALPALTRRALAHLTTELVRTRVDAGREIAVAGSLVAVGSRLVTVGAGLVAVSQRLLIYARGDRDALLQRFLDARDRHAARRPNRPIRHIDGMIA